jgi:hypothetical protein
MKGFEDNEAFQTTPRSVAKSTGRKIIPNKEIYSRKYKGGKLTRHKYRHTARGDFLRAGVDYGSSYWPSASSTAANVAGLRTKAAPGSPPTPRPAPAPPTPSPPSPPPELTRKIPALNQPARPPRPQPQPHPGRRSTPHPPHAPHPHMLRVQPPHVGRQILGRPAQAAGQHTVMSAMCVSARRPPTPSNRP